MKPSTVYIVTRKGLFIDVFKTKKLADECVDKQLISDLPDMKIIDVVVKSKKS